MTEETLERLRKKAASLPRRPGVYLMHNKAGTIIYVGKSRALRDRVSQYFHLSADANLKTVRMVSQIDDFDFILCDTEMEALTLENAKIKQYAPKYNIRLKDAKSYPYIKVSVQEEYPRITMTRKRVADGAKYFGPYSGVSTVYDVLGILSKTFGIPNCKRKFPRDIGKERPCIYKQLGKCVAPCDGSVTKEEYRAVIDRAILLLRGNVREAVTALETQMLACAEEERYEEAARCRDGIASLKKLGESQKVVGSPDAEFDVIGVYTDDVGTSVSVFYIRSGVIYDHENFCFGAYEIGENFLGSFLCELYTKREYIPQQVLLAERMDDGERDAVAEILRERAGRKITVRTPERGDNAGLTRMVSDNARQMALEFRRKSEGDLSILSKLSQMLQLPTVPERIEAYDISNLGKEYVTAGMVVCENGRFKKSDYRVFRIREVAQDDYGSMRETLRRRMEHLGDREDGSFSTEPDLILLDGGAAHVSVVRELLREMGLSHIPVYGMVKDDHHKTRTIVSDDAEIDIAKENDVFVFVYKLQEEVHRFTVGHMEGAKRKSLRMSALETVPGIGKKRATMLHSRFGTLAGMKNATEAELAAVVGEKNASALYRFLHDEEGENNQ